MDLMCCTKLFGSVRMDRSSVSCYRSNKAKRSWQTQCAFLWNEFILPFHFIHWSYWHGIQEAEGAKRLIFNIKWLASICLVCVCTCVSLYKVKWILLMISSYKNRAIFSLYGMLVSGRRLKHYTLGFI